MWMRSSLLFKGYRGSSRGLKRSGRDVDQSPLSSAEVRNEWRCTSVPSTWIRVVDVGGLIDWLIYDWVRELTVPMHLLLKRGRRGEVCLLLKLLSLLVTWCTNSLTFNNCTLCPRCIYVFCIYLRTNSDLCHLQHKLTGLYNRDEKCLLRGTDSVFK
jgi:hypothetical protein